MKFKKFFMVAVVGAVVLTGSGMVYNINSGAQEMIELQVSPDFDRDIEEHNSFDEEKTESFDLDEANITEVETVADSEEDVSDSEEDVSDEEVETVTNGMAYGYYSYKEDGVTKKGLYWYKNNKKIIDSFFFDGSYTYFLQHDGTPMKNYLTYHPDGEHIIYFDSYGHEVFNDFKYCDAVGYTCYFDSQGYLYKDQITWNEDGYPVYLNANGKLEDSGWFQFANGRDYGYANADGSLISDGFNYDPSEKTDLIYYFHWNGMVARGLIQDYNYYYNMDQNDGHYSGKFSTGVAPVFNTYENSVNYIVGVNLEPGEVMVSPSTIYADCILLYFGRHDGYYTSSGMGNRIFTLKNGDILYATKAEFRYDVNNTLYTKGIYTDDLTGKEQYSYEVKAGVHILPGRYRIKMVDEYSQVEVLSSTLYSVDKTVDELNYDSYNSFQVDRLPNRLFYHSCMWGECSGTEYIEVTVNEGEILHVDYVGEVTYLGK